MVGYLTHKRHNLRETWKPGTFIPHRTKGRLTEMIVCQGRDNIWRVVMSQDSGSKRAGTRANRDNPSTVSTRLEHQHHKQYQTAKELGTACRPKMEEHQSHKAVPLPMHLTHCTNLPKACLLAFPPSHTTIESGETLQSMRVSEQREARCDPIPVLPLCLQTTPPLLPQVASQGGMSHTLQLQHK